MGANAELLSLAARASRLLVTACRENENYRLARKLARDPHDIEALAESTVYEAKVEGGLFAEFFETPQGFVMLQFALAQVSYLFWEDLWNETHPDRFGQAWDSEDFALMSKWREKVRTMIKECHQESILAMHADEYIARLMDAGASEEAAEELTEWLSRVVYEQTMDSH